jgi:hypothetical protein
MELSNAKNASEALTPPASYSSCTITFSNSSENRLGIELPPELLFFAADRAASTNCNNI